MILRKTIFCTAVLIIIGLASSVKLSAQPPSMAPPPSSSESESEEETMEAAPQLNAPAVDQAPDYGMDYYKEFYEETFDELFEDVYSTIKEQIQEIGCMIRQERNSPDEDGFYRGVIKSDMCMFAEGKRYTFDSMKVYSLEIPNIRGAIWQNARREYKFIIQEQEDGMVLVKLTCEMSGHERYVTDEVHFWQSNGYFESMMMDRLRDNLTVAAG